MKINISTKITGEKIVLVPYRKHHVEKYHEWMSRSEIQTLTASEPLTLDEEHQMQNNWQIDDDKLTFIILKKDLYDSLESCDQIEREIQSMIGDVNLFLQSNDEYENGSKNEGELEVMIVDNQNRGRGYGSEAIQLLMVYCINFMTNPKIKRFFVKIGEENEPSIRMFKKLDFLQYEHIYVFKQIGLEFKMDNESLKKFESFKLNIDLNYT